MATKKTTKKTAKKAASKTAALKTIYFELTLDRHVGFPPARVNAAADVNKDNRTQANEDIQLMRSNLKWSGTKKVPFIDDLTIMVDYTGSIGARYSARARIGDANGKLVAKADGSVVMVPAPLWLFCNENGVE